MSDDLIHLHRARVRRAQSLGTAGITLTVLAPLPPLAAPALDERWLIAIGLLMAGGICMVVSHWLLGRLLR
jgi:hypothetical protein